MSIIVLLIVGLVVGALARAVLPGKQALPIWLTMLIGAGSLLLAGVLIKGEDRGFLEIIVGVIIAAVVIAITQGGFRARSTRD